MRMCNVQSLDGGGALLEFQSHLAPRRPEQELGSVYANRTPLKFPEICGMDNGLGHRMGKRKQNPFQ